MKGIKEKMITIAIAIILTMFIFYGISTFYPRVERDDYCKDIYGTSTKAECEAKGGAWSYYEGARPIPIKENQLVCTTLSESDEEISLNCIRGSIEERSGNCECTAYDNARETRSRTVFIIALAIGLVAVLLGTMTITLPSVGSGVMAGGILTVIFGTMQYWGDLPDFARFIALGVVLTILIVLAYKKLKK